ncbi:Dyak\GE10210-PA-like protein [Anopheles sinensis]|uniref:Dyak\GE10210-PA-like protein n=1 Tax=Anopheles sinensis TaxID=74873 RepID=A0A084WMA3_ANOSI|nr:Dyak\GE10210-PA-like protein [Anopheles sinensis]
MAANPTMKLTVYGDGKNLPTVTRHAPRGMLTVNCEGEKVKMVKNDILPGSTNGKCKCNRNGKRLWELLCTVQSTVTRTDPRFRLWE